MVSKNFKRVSYVLACVWLVICSALTDSTNLYAQDQPTTINKKIFSEPGGSFVGVAEGDFNQDGLPDLAICDRGNTQVILLFNSKDSSAKFQPFRLPLKDLLGNPNGGSNPSTGLSSIAVGDVDKDGLLDIVVTVDGEASTVIVLYLLDSKDMKFAIRGFPAPPDPTAVKLADVTGVPDASNGKPTHPDGAPEILMLSQRTNTLTVLINNGVGIFGLGRVTETGGFAPIAQTLGDFNNDGKLDVAILNRATSPNPNQPGPASVSVLLGSADGGFSPLDPKNPTIPVAPGSVSIVAAGYGVVQNGVQVDLPDLNGDGVTDLVVAAELGGNASEDITNLNGGKETASIQILLGDPSQNGQFKLAPSPISLENTISNTGRIALFPGATDLKSKQRIGSGDLILEDFDQNGTLDLYVGGVERNNGGIVSKIVGKVGNDFAASMTISNLFAPNLNRSFRVLPSDSDDLGTIQAKAPGDVDAITGAVSASNYVVSKTGQVVTLLDHDFDNSTNNLVPDTVQVTLHGNVYLSTNLQGAINHAPILTTSRGLGDFNGPGRNAVVKAGEEVKITLKATDVDPAGKGFKFTLTQSPKFVSIVDNKNGTATVTIKPEAADGSNDNNGLGKAYKVMAEVSDEDVRLPLTSRLTFGIYVNLSGTTSSSVKITSAAFYNQKKLMIVGSGFGSTPTVLINDKAISPTSTNQNGVSDTQIIMKGSTSKLNLQKGANTIQVIGSGGQKSNSFTLVLAAP